MIPLPASSCHMPLPTGVPLQHAHPAPVCLPACLQYEVKVVGILANGRQVPAPNALMFKTPALGAPVIADSAPKSPTTATIILNPPAAGPRPEMYIVTLCQQVG